MSHFSIGDSLPSGDAGCHWEEFQGEHCHEIDQNEQDAIVYVGGALILATIWIVRARKKKKEEKAEVARTEPIRLRDILEAAHAQVIDQL